jgi:hypothetical protein
MVLLQQFMKHGNYYYQGVIKYDNCHYHSLYVFSALTNNRVVKVACSSFDVVS